jgi:hypothetical protein
MLAQDRSLRAPACGEHRPVWRLRDRRRGSPRRTHNGRPQGLRALRDGRASRAAARGRVRPESRWERPGSPSADRHGLTVRICAPGLADRLTPACGPAGSSSVVTPSAVANGSNVAPWRRVERSTAKGELLDRIDALVLGGARTSGSSDRAPVGRQHRHHAAGTVDRPRGRRASAARRARPSRRRSWLARGRRTLRSAGGGWPETSYEGGNHPGITERSASRRLPSSRWAAGRRRSGSSRSGPSRRTASCAKPASAGRRWA